MEGKNMVSRKHRKKLSFFVGGNFSGIIDWNSFVITEITLFSLKSKQFINQQDKYKFWLNSYLITLGT